MPKEPMSEEPSAQQKLGWIRPLKKNVKHYATTDLIDWIAAFAVEGKHEWGFIKDEIMKRVTR